VRCKTFWERYDRLDARTEPGPALKRHLASCDACRAEAELLQKTIRSFSEDIQTLSPAAEGALEDRVMAIVRLLPPPQREFFTVRDWIIAGFVILLSMTLMPFGQDFERLLSIFGTSFALPLALVLGLGITLYGILFVGTHIDETMDFVKRRIIREH
jgi:anti-sigma factor RsiW